jgi:hypothetical protein
VKSAESINNLMVHFIYFLIILLLHSQYTVTFTKVFTIYHSWTHPLHHSPLTSLSPFLNSFNESHFSTFIHEYIIFYHIHPPIPFPLPSHWYQPLERVWADLRRSGDKREDAPYRWSMSLAISDHHSIPLTQVSSYLEDKHVKKL